MLLDSNLFFFQFELFFFIVIMVDKCKLCLVCVLMMMGKNVKHGSRLSDGEMSSPRGAICCCSKTPYC